MKKNEKKYEEFPIEEFEGLEQVNFEAQVLYKFYKNDGKYKEMLKMDLQGLKTHKDIPTWFNAMAENMLNYLCFISIIELIYFLSGIHHNLSMVDKLITHFIPLWSVNIIIWK